MAEIREGANRASPSEAASYVEEWDRIEQDKENRLDQLDAEYKEKKRTLVKSASGDQKAILEEAKRVGVKKGVVRAIGGGQKRLRKAAEDMVKAKGKAVNGIDELDGDEREFAVDILTALGDDFASFGLGKAAVEKKAKPRKTAAQAADEAWSSEEKTTETVN